MSISNVYLKCLYCDGENMYHFKESIFVEKRKITKDLKISKKTFETYTNDGNAIASDSIECLDCGGYHWYKLDSSGRIIELGKLGSP